MAVARTAAIVLAAANNMAVCLPQQPAQAGPLLLNGTNAAGSGMAVLDAARRIQVTTQADESANTLLLVGFDRERNPIIEAVALPNTGTAYTVQDFLYVEVASLSAPASGPISVGTNGVASTRWIRMDANVPNVASSAGINFGSAVATATLEVTLDPVDKQAQDRLGGTMDESVAGLAGSAFLPPAPFAVQGGANLAGDTLVQIDAPVHAVRLTVLSGAQTPGLRLTVLQQGLRA